MKANVKHALRKLGYYQQEPLEFSASRPTRL